MTLIITQTIKKWNSILKSLNIDEKYHEKLVLYAEQHSKKENEKYILGHHIDYNPKTINWNSKLNIESTLHLALKTLSKIEDLDKVDIFGEREEAVQQSVSFNYDDTEIPGFRDLCESNLVTHLSDTLNKSIALGNKVIVHSLFNSIHNPNDIDKINIVVLHNYSIVK